MPATGNCPLTTAEAYEAASHMWDRQHDRWTQWMLFYFGGLAGIFVAYGNVRFKLWIALAAAALISVAWAAIAVALRLQARAWRIVVMRVERGKTKRPLTDYWLCLKAHSWKLHRREWAACLKFWDRKTLFSVTRWQVLLATTFAATFLAASVATLLGLGPSLLACGSIDCAGP